MRKFGFAILIASTFLAMGSLAPQQAAAMTIGAAPAGLRSAIVGTEIVATVSCFRNGWRGWANYPSCEKKVRKKRYKGMHKNK